jgi:hypothetical protein
MLYLGKRSTADTFVNTGAVLGVSVYTTEGSERHRLVAGPEIVTAQTTHQHTRKQNIALTVSETGKYMKVQRPRIKFITSGANHETA